MKVIFLDIDGVLNSDFWVNTHSLEISKGEYIDESKVRLLARIVNETNAFIVMHSGWRFWFDSMMQPIRSEAQILVDLFKKVNLSIYDKTPDLSTPEIKKNKKFSLVKTKEIIAWLSQHQEVEQYIILDDLYLHNDEIAKYQIRTSSSIGLTKNQVERAIKMLNVQNNDC